MISTFSGFYVAKGGMDAARASLSITGQNMTNARTAGYTRQRVDLYAAGSSGRNSRYAEAGPIIGRGVEIGGVSQIRDPYLDLRYRREHSKLGNTATQLGALTDLEGIIDEVLKDGVNKQLEDFKSQLNNLSTHPGDPVAESIVKNSALTLIKLFNSTSTQLANSQKEQLTYLEGAVKDVNQLLSGIAGLNGEIRKANVVGDQALELLDQRNLMLDQLSGYLNIEIKTKQVDIGSGHTVDELQVNMIGDNGQTFSLINNKDFGSFKFDKDPVTNEISIPVEMELYGKDGNLIDDKMSDQFGVGAFAGHLKMLNNSGEYGTPPSTQRGIGYFQGRLDTLASEFANAFNKINSTNEGPDWNKPMFESSEKGEPITAANIRISTKWANSTESYITATKGTDPTVKNDNLIAMLKLFDEPIDFATPGSTPVFKGTIGGYFKDMSVTLGIEKEAVKRENDSYNSVISDIDDQRSSISGVSENEEGVNLIQFNHALTAASRFMTTLDEAVDTIINRMGIVGR